MERRGILWFCFVSIIGAIFIAASLSGCQKPYDEIKYVENNYGKIQIDSAKFRPVLMMHEWNKIVVVEADGKIKEFSTWDPSATVFTTIVFVAIIMVLIFLRISVGD